ncbi:MAG: CARDB domain-containing protein, partial [Thermoplasmatota archaeon]
LGYSFTVGKSGRIYHEFVSEKNVTLNANKESEVSFKIYVLNQGNIPVDYNLTASSSMLLYADIVRGEATLLPSESAQAEITIEMPPSEDRLIGTIELRTSGSPKKVSWEVRIESRFPDLEADEIIRLTDPDPVLGDRITLLGTVRNKGDVEAETVVCSFYEDEELIGSSTIDYLGPGEEATAPGVEWQPVGTGEREITLRIDPDELLVEEEEDNNEAYKSFSFFPDISISSVELQPPIVRKGDEVKATIVVKNNGNADITRGFEVELRNGGSQGGVIATRDFEDDIDARGGDTVQVEMIFDAPDIDGKVTIWFGVTIKDLDERKLDNNELTGEVEIETPASEGPNYMLFGIIGVAAAVVIVGGGLYVWKFGLPLMPPPGEEGGSEPSETEDGGGPRIEAIPPEPIGSTGEEGEIEEEPLVEMHLEIPAQEEEPLLEEPVEEVIIAEVVDEEEEPIPPEPEPPIIEGDEDDEGLIPEI